MPVKVLGHSLWWGITGSTTLMWEAAVMSWKVSYTIKDPWYSPRLTSGAFHRRAAVFHSVASDSVKAPRHQERWLGTPTWTWMYITHSTLGPVGFPHNQGIKTATITSTKGHLNCNNQLLSLNPRAVVSVYSFLSLSFFSLYYFLSDIFMFLYCYIIIDNNKQNSYIPTFNCNQVILK